MVHNHRIPLRSRIPLSFPGRAMRSSPPVYLAGCTSRGATAFCTEGPGPPRHSAGGGQLLGANDQRLLTHGVFGDGFLMVVWWFLNVLSWFFDGVQWIFESVFVVLDVFWRFLVVLDGWWSILRMCRWLVVFAFYWWLIIGTWRGMMVNLLLDGYWFNIGGWLIVDKWKSRKWLLVKYWISKLIYSNLCTM